MDGVPAQLQNEETFVLPSAPNNLNVEMGSDVTFPPMWEKTSESWRTPQAETADPCRGTSQLKFSLCCTMKVQHCKSHGVLNKNADPDCNGCISVRSCRSVAAAHPCNHSANAEHLVPRVRPGPLDHKLKESWRTPTHHEQTGRLRNSDFAQLRKHFRCKNVQHCRAMKYSTKMHAQGVAAASV